VSGSILSDLLCFFIPSPFKFLDTFNVKVKLDRATLINIAHTSLSTKLTGSLANQLAADVVDAVIAIRPRTSEKR